MAGPDRRRRSPASSATASIYSAANLDKSWIGTDADALFTKAVGEEVHVVNDADAAGLAEVRFGAGRDRAGVVLVLTFGTGIGSGLFMDGVLVPNTELGPPRDRRPRRRVEGRGQRPRPRGPVVEGVGRRGSSATCDVVVKLFSPELVIVGGGASRKADKWLPHIDVDTEVVPAALENEAGIVGAALLSAAGHPPT